MSFTAQRVNYLNFVLLNKKTKQVTPIPPDESGQAFPKNRDVPKGQYHLVKKK